MSSTPGLPLRPDNPGSPAAPQDTPRRLFPAPFPRAPSQDVTRAAGSVTSANRDGGALTRVSAGPGTAGPPSCPSPCPGRTKGGGGRAKERRAPAPVTGSGGPEGSRPPRGGRKGGKEGRRGRERPEAGGAIPASLQAFGALRLKELLLPLGTWLPSLVVKVGSFRSLGFQNIFLE